jgi:hypothetical protein
MIGVLSLGVILASTLTPLDPSVVPPQPDVRSCDYSRTWLPPLTEMFSGNDVTLNILLFLPLGWAIGMAPWSARKAIVTLAAVISPIAIEAAQLVVPLLARGCESADVVDNLTGLVVGFAGGIVFAWIAPFARRPLEPGI